jgi:hypothetical protein
VAEGARLESVYTLTGIGGSNPSLSASISVVRSFDSPAASLSRRSGFRLAAQTPRKTPKNGMRRRHSVTESVEVLDRVRRKAIDSMPTKLESK